MTRWERLELWLFDHDVEEFTSTRLAHDLRVNPRQATMMIQAYLTAQRGKNSSTLFVLKREGRTRAAIWSAGQRTGDAKIIGRTLFEDVRVKATRAFEPDLARLADRNPRAARYCKAKIEAVMDHALGILAASLDQYDRR